MLHGITYCNMTYAGAWTCPPTTTTTTNNNNSKNNSNSNKGGPGHALRRPVLVGRLCGRRLRGLPLAGDLGAAEAHIYIYIYIYICVYIYIYIEREREILHTYYIHLLYTPAGTRAGELGRRASRGGPQRPSLKSSGQNPARDACASICAYIYIYTYIHICIYT